MSDASARHRRRRRWPPRAGRATARRRSPSRPAATRSTSVHYGSVAVVDRHGRLLYCGGRSALPDDDPQRAEAVPGDAVRRRGRRRALRLLAGAGRAAVRQPFRRAAARRRRSPTCWPVAAAPRPNCSAARMRRATTRCAAKCRRRRRVRRSRTTARASTAGCSPTASTAAAEGRLPRVRPSAAAGDPPLRRAFHRTPEAELVAGIDGCSAPNYAVPLSRLALAYRAPCRRARRRRSTAAAPRILADAMTAHPEMVSGEGRNDLALHARRARRLGHQDRRRGRAGDRHSQPRASASRSRSPTAPSAACIRRRSRCSTSWDCSTPISAPRSRPWREPIVRNYRGIATGRVRPLVVVDKAEVRSSAQKCRTRDAPAT